MCQNDKSRADVSTLQKSIDPNLKPFFSFYDMMTIKTEAATQLNISFKKDFMQEARYMMGENLKVVWAKFSSLKAYLHVRFQGAILH